MLVPCKRPERGACQQDANNPNGAANSRLDDRDLHRDLGFEIFAKILLLNRYEYEECWSKRLKEGGKGWLFEFRGRGCRSSFKNQA